MMVSRPRIHARGRTLAGVLVACFLSIAACSGQAASDPTELIENGLEALDVVAHAEVTGPKSGERFAIDVTVTLVTDADPTFVSDALSKVEEIATEGDTIVNSLTLQYERAQSSQELYWASDKAKCTLAAQMRLWAGLLEATTDAVVNVSVEPHGPLQIAVMTATIHGPPTTTELYTRVVELCQEVGIDLTSTAIVVWATYSLSITQLGMAPESLLVALDQAQALINIAYVTVASDIDGIRVLIQPERGSSNSNYQLFTKADGVAVVELFRAQGALSDDLSIVVATPEGVARSVLWPET